MTSGIGVPGDSRAWMMRRNDNAVIGQVWARNHDYGDPFSPKRTRLSYFTPIIDVLVAIKEKPDGEEVSHPAYTGEDLTQELFTTHSLTRSQLSRCAGTLAIFTSNAIQDDESRSMKSLLLVTQRRQNLLYQVKLSWQLASSRNDCVLSRRLEVQPFQPGVGISSLHGRTLVPLTSDALESVDVESIEPVCSFGNGHEQQPDLLGLSGHDLTHTYYTPTRYSPPWIYILFLYL